MSKLYKFFLLILITGIAIACDNNPPAGKIYEKNPQYDWGYALFYGNYYEDIGLENNVLSLSLFTKDLSVSNGTLYGTGQYLFLEELYLAPADTLLPEGIYTINDTHEPMTAFSGQVPEEYPYTIIGAYITYIDDSSVTYMMIEQGTFEVKTPEEDIFSITFDLLTTSGMELKGSFTGELTHFDAMRKTEAPENVIKQSWERKRK